MTNTISVNRKLFFEIIALRSVLMTIIFLVLLVNQAFAQKGYEVCHTIFDRLKSAKGMLLTEGPYLEVVNALPEPTFKIAMARDDRVFLDTATVNVCTKMGKDSLNALAFILSHELAHFVKGHLQSHQYIEETERDERLEIISTAEVSDRRTKRKINSILKKYGIRVNEAEADLEAGFISYLAGYRSLDAGPEMLQRCYERFGMDVEEGNYASLEERKEMVRAVALKLDSLIYIFEAGNLASVVAKDELAKSAYAYIAETFTTPALLNNMAVTELRRYADAQFGPNGMMYELPFTMSLPVPDEYGTVDEDITDMEAYLREQERLYRIAVAEVDRSLDKLRMARQINDQYYEAFLNESIAYYLRFKTAGYYAYKPEYYHDDLQYAAGAALRAKNILLDDAVKNAKALGDVHNMLAILSHVQSDSTQSASHLQVAENYTGHTAMIEINRGVLQGERGARRDYYMDIDNIMAMQSEWPRWDDAQGKERTALWDSSATWDGIALDQVVVEKLGAWNFTKVLEPELPKSTQLVKLQRKFSFGGNKDFRCYRIAEYKGQATITKSTIFLIPSSHARSMLHKSIGVGMSYDELTTLLGDPFSKIETQSATLVRYSGVIFTFQEGALKSWTYFREYRY